MAGLVLQLLLVSLHSGRSGYADAVGSTAALQSVVICTTQGAVPVLVDAEGNPVQHPALPGDNTSAFCPLCAALNSFVLAQTENRATLRAPHAASIKLRPYSQGILAGRVVEVHRNRGPPALAVS